MTPEQRKAQLGRIHAAKATLGLGDEEYRDLLDSLTGERSCAAMNDRQVNHVLDWLNWLAGRRTRQPMIHGRFAGQDAHANLVRLAYAISRIVPPGFAKNPIRSMGWQERTCGRAAAFFEEPQLGELVKLIEGAKAIFARAGRTVQAAAPQITPQTDTHDSLFPHISKAG